MIWKTTCLCLALLISCFASVISADTTSTETVLTWKNLPALPDANGVAGAFAGASNGALLAGGGANFPNGMPWENGVKVWHDELYVLPEGADQWRTGFKLPAPRAYGVSVTTQNGVFCIGGSDSERHYNDVYRLNWDGNKVNSKELSSLPVPLANAGGAIIDSTVYVVGGSESPTATSASAHLYSLKLNTVDAQWKILEPLPGPGRILPVVAALNNTLYVASGASLHAGAGGNPERTYLLDAWKYTPSDGWEKLANMPRPAVAAPAIVPDVPGNSSLFVVGGDDGSLVGFKPPDKHPGFPAETLTYNTVTNTWANRGIAPVSVVTAPVAAWNDGSVIVSGEIRPGVRTAEVAHVILPPHEANFGFLNYVTLGIYLAGILGIGLVLSSGNATADDFFRGGQKIPWWCAGLSIFATTLSSITFMSVPAKAFAENWVFALANLPILLIAPFIVYVIMPVFRRMDLTSAYEYLERRFNLAIRLFGSAAFVLFQIGRMSIVMFLPALALATVTDFSITTCILLMGLLTIIYCAFGGITAVIWTDVVQSIIFLGGALLTITYILFKTKGGVTEFIDIAMANDKLKAINWTWDYTVAAFWVVIIGNIFSNLITYSSDQSTIQRYMTTADEKKAARSIWLNAIVAMPATVLFFGVGTALYVYYVQHPVRLAAGIQNDAVFPLFISRELPAGVAGLLVASIFAAAQSTVSTSMNSTSTVVVTDWFIRLRKSPSTDSGQLALARWLTVLFGILGTGGALWLAMSDIRSVWDVFLKVLGLTGGALAGLFLLGIFSQRANGTGAVVGAAVSVVTLLLVQQYTEVHFFLYGMIGILTCIIVGYIASLVAPAPTAVQLHGLTFFGGRRDKATRNENDTVPQVEL